MKNVFYALNLLLLSLLCVPELQAQQSYARNNSRQDSPDPDLNRANSFLTRQNGKNRFEENKGQVTGADAAQVRYTYKDDGLSVFLLQTGIAYQFHKNHYPEGYGQPGEEGISREQERKRRTEEVRTETYRMDVQLLGANPRARIIAEGKSDDPINYYNHNILGVHRYSRITYYEVYPYIDWVIYTSGNQIKYDFVVKPGGNPANIRLQTAYAERLALGEDGSLNLRCSMGSITEQAPVSYQQRQPVRSRFVLKDGIISFEIGAYNDNDTLVIDPTLEWATYYGGNGMDFGQSCVADDRGAVYLAGHTESTTNIAAGGHQNTRGGLLDIFLVKFNSNGVRQWATYYGGNLDEWGYSCAVDKSGAVYVAGTVLTNGNDLAYNGHQNTFGGNRDAILIKFDGSGIRQWATYYGGTGADYGYSCTVDQNGAVYLAGKTESTTQIASAGHQDAYSGNGDAFLVKFNSNGARLWGTYYGGSNSDEALYCATDNNDAVYLSGVTASTSSMASGGHQDAYGGGTNDGFLVKFNGNGVRQWATYYGGSSSDRGHSCATDSKGAVYLGGLTTSSNNIFYNGHQTKSSSSGATFLVKFNSAGIRQWGTYYAAGPALGGYCAVDNSDAVYLAGSTLAMTDVASNGYQNTTSGKSEDAFLVKFNSNGIRQWGTYYGQSPVDHGTACATDKSGAVYLAGQTYSTTGMALGGHQNTFGGGNTDAFFVKFMDCPTVFSEENITICGSQLPYTWNGILVTEGGIPAAIYHTPSLLTGCDSAVSLNLTANPLLSVKNGARCEAGSVTLSASSPASGALFNWYTMSTGGSPIASGATFSTPSLSATTAYYVTATANGCESARTPVLATIIQLPVVSLGNDTAICNGSSLTLTATSTAPIRSYLWDDASTAPSRDVHDAGTYYVTVTDTASCKGSDTIQLTLRPLKIVDLGNDTAICEGNPFTLDAGTPGSTYTWDDKTTQQTRDVTTAGTYFVALTDPNGCKDSDTISISLQSPPSGVIYIVNNHSGNYSFNIIEPKQVTGCQWSFGDANLSNITHPTYTYSANGEYTITLTLYGLCDTVVLTAPLTVSGVTGIRPVHANQLPLDVYPNPTQNRLHISSPDGIGLNTIEVYNIPGQRVYRTDALGKNIYTLNLGGLAAGMYFLKINTDQGMVMRKFEVVQ